MARQEQEADIRVDSPTLDTDILKHDYCESSKEGTGKSSKRVAACVNCNRLKTKCIREAGQVSCKRCANNGEHCFTPVRKFGRVLGSKNRKTLLRLSQQQQQAFSKPTVNTSDDTSPSDALPLASDVALYDISALSSLAEFGPLPDLPDLPELPALISSSASESTIEGPFTSSDSEPLQMFNLEGYHLADSPNYDFEGLLERFRFCAKTLDPENGRMSHLKAVQEGLNALFSKDSEMQGQISAFGKSDLPKLDVGLIDYDPISTGLLTWRDAEALFKTYYLEVQPTLRVLDPFIHTITYVRSKSSFLFSVILEIAAAHQIEQSETLLLKIRKHTDWLVSEIHLKGYKSVEICQGFQLRSAWQLPNTESLLEQRVWQYLGAAVTMAIELRLDNLTPLCASASSEWKFADPIHRERLVRNCQRAWLCLFNRDRAIATMLGRKPVLPEGPLLQPAMLHTWHRSPYALAEDVSTVAAVSLRHLIAKVLACHKSSPNNFEAVQKIVDQGISDWRLTWQPEMTDSDYNYYNLTVSFTRFSVIATPYDYALRNKTLPETVRDQCLLAALEACQAAVTYLHARNAEFQAASRRQFAPTMRLTLIMYAAFASIKLLESCQAPNDGMGASVDIYHLAILAQLALQMKQVGSAKEGRVSVAHRFGSQLLAAARKVAVEKVAHERAQYGFDTPSIVQTPISPPNIMDSNPLALPDFNLFDFDSLFVAEASPNQPWTFLTGVSPPSSMTPI